MAVNLIFKKKSEDDLASRPSPGEQPGEITGTDFESDDYQEEKPLMSDS